MIPNEISDLRQSLQHSVLKDDFCASIHESQKSFSSVIVFIVLFVVPGYNFCWYNFELNCC